MIEHLSRTRRYDTYEVWSHERACSCVAKALRPDRRDAARCAAGRGRPAARVAPPAHRPRVRPARTGRSSSWRRSPARRWRTCSRIAASTTTRWPGSGCIWPPRCSTCTAVGSCTSTSSRRTSIAADGRAVLIDLSLARAPGRYRPGSGTWCHLSPEQARGDVLEHRRRRVGARHGPVRSRHGTSRRSRTTRPRPSTWQTDDQVDAGFPQLLGPAPPATGALAAAIDACLAFDSGRPPDPVRTRRGARRARARRPPLEVLMRRYLLTVAGCAAVLVGALAPSAARAVARSRRGPARTTEPVDPGRPVRAARDRRRARRPARRPARRRPPRLRQRQVGGHAARRRGRLRGRTRPAGPRTAADRLRLRPR